MITTGTSWKTSESGAGIVMEMAMPGSDHLLGCVHHLIETGANDVLVVAPCEGSIDDRERLIPYLPDEVIRRVDLEAGRIAVDWFVNE